MPSWKLLFTISLFLSITGFSQSITIVDSTSGEPIEDVLVYTNSSEITAVSDKRGKVNLNSFADDEFLIFNHAAYVTVYLKKSEINTKENFLLAKADNVLPQAYIDHTLRYFLVEDDEAAQIETIPIEIVRLENPESSADMLQNTGNVLVQKSQGGGGSPMIRGFEANKLLLVIDGVRMNNAIYRSGHLQNAITVDNSVLDHTEIIFGPSSSLYGSDALGGVIHFHTADPEITNSDTAYFHGNSYVRYNNNNNLSGNFNFSIGKNKWGLLSSFTASTFGDTKMGENRFHGYDDWGLHTNYVDRINGVDTMLANPDPNTQIGIGYHQFDFLEKFVYVPSDKLKMTLNFQYSTSSDINRYDKLTEYRNGVLRYAEWYYGPQNRMFGALKLDFSSKSKWFKNGVMTLSYQKIDEDRISRNFDSEWKEFQEEDVSVLGLNLDFNKLFTKSRIIYYGLEVQENIVSSTAYAQNILSSERNGAQTRYPFSSNYLNAGAYLEYKQKFINDNVFTAGIRYSFIYANSQFDDTSFVALPFNEVNISTGAPSGHVGMVFKPHKNTRFKTLVSSGFRAPNIDDYGKVFENSGNTVVPNDQVQPEYALGGEVSFEQKFGKELITIGAAIYGTYLFNALVQQDFTLNGEDSIEFNGEITKIQALQNTDNAVVYGINAYTKVNFTENLSLDASYNFTKGTDLANNIPLEHIAPQFGRIAVTFKKDNWNTALTSLYNFRKNFSDYQSGGDNIDLTPNEGGTPPWWALNYRLSYTFAETITAQFAVRNILDAHYMQFASGISAPGRSFMIGLRAKF